MYVKSRHVLMDEVDTRGTETHQVVRGVLYQTPPCLRDKQTRFSPRHLVSNACIYRRNLGYWED